MSCLQNYITVSLFYVQVRSKHGADDEGRHEDADNSRAVAGKWRLLIRQVLLRVLTHHSKK